MNKIILASLLTLSTMISGCVFSVPYDRPEDPNSPTVFVNSPERGGFLYFKNGEDCSGTVDLPDEFFDGGRLNTPFPVPGNKMLAIAMTDRYAESADARTYIVSCTALTSFVPEPNREYTVNYIAAGESCGAAVFSRLKGSDDKLFLMDSALMREPAVALTATSASCLPIDN